MCDSRKPLNGADSQPNPLDIDCGYCGALAGELCNYDCLSEVEDLREETA